jgi:hypothetical protein
VVSLTNPLSLSILLQPLTILTSKPQYGLGSMSYTLNFFLILI